MPQTPKPKEKVIFISHATEDAEIAKAIILLMQTGMDIPDKRIFCTSVPGLGIKTGVNFIDFVKGKIQKPAAVIILLTPHYYAKEFCLCELGATWAMSHRQFPLLFPSFNYDDIKGVLTGTQLLKIEKATDLNTFQEELCEELGVTKKNSNRWEDARSRFIKSVKKLIKNYAPPVKISPVEHKKLQNQLKSRETEIKEVRKQIKAAQDTLNEVSKLKPQADVEKVLLKKTAELPKYDALVAKVKKATRPLPSIVIDVLFYDNKNERYRIPSQSEDDAEATYSAIRRAIDDGYLEDHLEDGFIAIDDEDGEIGEAQDALRELEAFLRNASDVFHENFFAKNKFQAQLSNKRFWNLIT